MKITHRIFLVLLLPVAGIATPVHADLIIQELEVAAYAEVHGLPFNLQESSGDVPPYDVTAVAETPDYRAFSMQTKNGFFHNYASINGAVPDSGSGLAYAESMFHLVVGADAPDTPLLLNFNFLGAQAVGTAYYGYGRMDITVAQTISYSFNGGPLTNIWGFQDTVALNAPSTSDWTRTRDFSFDGQGIGLPGETLNYLFYPPGSFTTSMSLELLPFFGTLNFGVLQPGQTFELNYNSNAIAEGTLSYPGQGANAVARLIDPFSLGGGDPPPQLEMQGLTLPSLQPAVVPESGSYLLFVAGLLPLWRIISRRRCPV